MFTSCKNWALTAKYSSNMTDLVDGGISFFFLVNCIRIFRCSQGHIRF